MTVSTETRVAGPYAANGVTTSFSFSFPLQSASDMKVVQNLAGVESELVSGFTVNLNADQDDNPGGTVDFSVAPASGRTITLESDMAYNQAVELVKGGDYQPSILNRVFDKLTMLVLQVKRLTDRSLKIPTSSDASADLPEPSADTVLGWNDDGTAIINVERADLASEVTSAAQASAVAAAASAVAAAASADAAELAATTAGDFINRYLGPFSSNPTTDNDGGALSAGLLYFNTASQEMRVYNGSGWVAAYVAGVTASELLALLLTVDGSGSGLDADLLDGQSSAAFAAASHNHSASEITSGSMADARIPASNVTQHQASLGTTASTVSTLARRDASGDLTARLHKSEYADDDSSAVAAVVYRVNNTTDNYLRACTMQRFRRQLVLNFTIQSDPGGTPSGSPGDVFVYY